MNCPLCIDQTLDVTHRKGIELDVCPKCHGIWLDRGEIDRLLGESEAESDQGGSTSTKQSERRDDDDDDDRRDRKRPERKRKRKKSLASRIGDAIEDAIDDLT